jgi:hypothetical protein
LAPARVAEIEIPEPFDATTKYEVLLVKPVGAVFPLDVVYFKRSPLFKLCLVMLIKDELTVELPTDIILLLGLKL